MILRVLPERLKVWSSVSVAPVRYPLFATKLSTCDSLSWVSASPSAMSEGIPVMFDHTVEIVESMTLFPSAIAEGAS